MLAGSYPIKFLGSCQWEAPPAQLRGLGEKLSVFIRINTESFIRINSNRGLENCFPNQRFSFVTEGAMITPSHEVFACSIWSVNFSGQKLSLALGLSSLWGREADCCLHWVVKQITECWKRVCSSRPFSSGGRGGKQIIAREAFHVPAQRTRGKELRTPLLGDLKQVLHARIPCWAWHPLKQLHTDMDKRLTLQGS